MNYKEWMSNIQSSGNLCSSYCDKVNGALSKKNIVDVVLDSNGVSFLMEMQSKGFELPYDVILGEFGNYINGKYVAEFKNEKGNGYKSCIYCCYEYDINVTTTLVSILGCNSDVYIRDNSVVRLYLDKNCKVRIHCPSSSLCMVEYWKGAEVEVIGNYDRVELIEN